MWSQIECLIYLCSDLPWSKFTSLYFFMSVYSSRMKNKHRSRQGKTKIRKEKKKKEKKREKRLGIHPFCSSPKIHTKPQKFHHNSFFRGRKWFILTRDISLNNIELLKSFIKDIFWSWSNYLLILLLPYFSVISFLSFSFFFTLFTIPLPIYLLFGSQKEWYLENIRFWTRNFVNFSTNFATFDHVNTF